MKQFGARLRIARIQINLSQQEVAAALKTTQPTVSSWETGATMPRIPQFALLAELYGMSTDLLLFGIHTIPVSLMDPSGDMRPKKLNRARYRELIGVLAREGVDSDFSRLIG